MSLLDSLFGVNRLLRAGVEQVTRRTWDFLGEGVTVADDPVNGKTLITFSGGGGAAAWNVRLINGNATAAAGDALISTSGDSPEYVITLPLITSENLGSRVLITNVFGAGLSMVATPSAGTGQAGLVVVGDEVGPTYDLNHMGSVVLVASDLPLAGGYLWIASSSTGASSGSLQDGYDQDSEIEVVDDEPLEIESSPGYPMLRLESGATGVDFFVGDAAPTHSAGSGSLYFQRLDGGGSRVWQNVSSGGAGTSWLALGMPPLTAAFSTNGVHSYTVPVGYRLRGCWIAPGAGGGGGGGSGGTPHTAGSSGGGGGGGSGGQGGGGAALRWVPLSRPAGTVLAITVGAGGGGGTFGDEPATAATAGNPGLAGADGGDTVIVDDTTSEELCRARNPGSGGAGGLGGAAGASGAGGAGAAAPTPAGLDWPRARATRGQMPNAGGAGGAPGVAGSAATDTAVAAGDLGPTVAIESGISGLGGAENGGVHGGGGGGSCGGSGGLGWELRTAIGAIPVTTVAIGGDRDVFAPGLDGLPGTGSTGGGGASGAPGTAGTSGRGGGGGSGGGGGGHAASGTATSNEGGAGAAGSPGAVILELVSA